MLWLDRIIFILLCSLIFVLPASKAAVAIFAIPAITLFLVKLIFDASSAPAGSTMRGRLSALLSPWPVMTPIVFYVLVCFISIFQSYDSGLSLKGFFGKVLQSVFFFLVIKGTLTTPRRLFQFLTCFAISTFILSLDGIWQHFYGLDIFKQNSLIDGRIRASMYHPNDLGAYLIIIIPLIFYLTFQAWNLWRNDRSRYHVMLLMGGLVASGAAFAVLSLTYSRSAWFGFLVGMALWALIRRSWKIFTFFVLVVIFVLTPMVVSKRDLPESDLPFLRRGAVEESSPATTDEGICGKFLGILNRGLSTSDRLNYWDAAVKIIKDQPVTGIGLNTYGAVVKEYAPQYPFYAHNTFLQVTAELGFPGLVVVLWVFMAPLIYALRKIRSIPDRFWSGILGAVAAGYVALLAECALDTSFYSVQLSILFWILMALLVAIPRAKA